MELVWGLLVIFSVWLGYRMGRGDKLEVKLPEKLKAVIRDDDTLAEVEKQLEDKNRGKKWK